MSLKAEEVYGMLKSEIKKGGQFNPDNYYNKNQIDQKLEDTYITSMTKAEIEAICTIGE